jgi:hypothetical protein
MQALMYPVDLDIMVRSYNYIPRRSLYAILNCVIDRVLDTLHIVFVLDILYRHVHFVWIMILS